MMADERMFTQNTLNDVVPGKEVPLVVYIWYLDPWISEKTTILGTDFDWTVFLQPTIALTWEWSNMKLSLIVVVAP